MIKKLYMHSLLGLLVILPASLRANIEDILMPWRWDRNTVAVTTLALSVMRQYNDNIHLDYDISAVRAYILGSQIPNILKPRRSSLYLDTTERYLAATALGAEVARSFYGVWLRRFKSKTVF